MHFNFSHSIELSMQLSQRNEINNVKLHACNVEAFPTHQSNTVNLPPSIQTEPIQRRKLNGKSKVSRNAKSASKRSNTGILF